MVSHFFTFKDRISKGLRSDVVSSFKCHAVLIVCGSNDLPFTQADASLRSFGNALTSKKRLNPSSSSVLLHLSETGCCIYTLKMECCVTRRNVSVPNKTFHLLIMALFRVLCGALTFILK